MELAKDRRPGMFKILIIMVVILVLTLTLLV
jgi:hypothetical protein